MSEEPAAARLLARRNATGVRIPYESDSTPSRLDRRLEIRHRDLSSERVEGLTVNQRVGLSNEMRMARGNPRFGILSELLGGL